MRRAFGIHSTRELMFMPDICILKDAPVVRLSPRGREILALFMSGHTYKQITERLGISRSAVRRHFEKMLWQNDCESMLELIARYRAQLAAEQTETHEGVSEE